LLAAPPAIGNHRLLAKGNSMSLEVIGAGFGRTGTLTLKTALEKLGFTPCHHMLEVIANPGQGAFWDRVANHEKVDWEEMFGPYRASVDWPSCAFYKELAAHYPKAKVILSLRDPHAWYKSVSNTIMPAMKGPIFGPDGKRVGPPGEFVQKIVGEQTFDNKFDEESMIAVFNRHNEEVRRVIPKDRLLVFQASEGWEPLCRFLGVPVPGEPFPKTNTSEEFMARSAALHATHQR